MMTAAERSDLLHIMKINRFALRDSDSACLQFAAEVGDCAYEVAVLTIEKLPTLTIKRNQQTIFSETLASVDDVKIFLEERLYTFLTAPVSN